MANDPYSPSPELVEGLAILNAHRSGWLWDDAGKHTQDVLRSDATAALTAAVAYRHPDGHPELVPWAQVQELVTAIKMLLEGGESSREGDWYYGLGSTLHTARAALAPFTQDSRI